MQMLLGSFNLFHAMKLSSPQLFLEQFYEWKKIGKWIFWVNNETENSENFFLETREAFNKIFNLMIFERWSTSTEEEGEEKFWDFFFASEKSGKSQALSWENDFLPHPRFILKAFLSPRSFSPLWIYFLKLLQRLRTLKIYRYDYNFRLFFKLIP